MGIFTSKNKSTGTGPDPGSNSNGDPGSGTVDPDANGNSNPDPKPPKENKSSFLTRFEERFRKWNKISSENGHYNNNRNRGSRRSRSSMTRNGYSNGNKLFPATSTTVHLFDFNGSKSKGGDGGGSMKYQRGGIGSLKVKGTLFGGGGGGADSKRQAWGKGTL